MWIRLEAGTVLCQVVVTAGGAVSRVASDGKVKVHSSIRKLRHGKKMRRADWVNILSQQDFLMDIPG